VPEDCRLFPVSLHTSDATCRRCNRIRALKQVFTLFWQTHLAFRIINHQTTFLTHQAHTLNILVNGIRTQIYGRDRSMAERSDEISSLTDFNVSNTGIADLN